MFSCHCKTKLLQIYKAVLNFLGLHYFFFDIIINIAKYKSSSLHFRNILKNFCGTRFLNPFPIGIIPVCDRVFESVNNIIIQVVPKKYFFKFYSNTEVSASELLQNFERNIFSLYQLRSGQMVIAFLTLVSKEREIYFSLPFCKRLPVIITWRYFLEIISVKL